MGWTRKNFLALTVILVCILAIGCASTDKTKIDPYQTVLASALIIDQGAQDVYVALQKAHTQGAVSEEDMAKVDKLYSDYDSAYRALVAGCVLYEQGNTDENLDALLDALKKAYDQLNLEKVLLGVFD